MPIAIDCCLVHAQWGVKEAPDCRRGGLLVEVGEKVLALAVAVAPVVAALAW